MIEERQLGDLINVQSGYAFKSKEYTDEGHFLVRIGNVQDGYLLLDKPKYVVLDDKTEKFALKEKDFLTSLTGNIGRVARVEKSHLPAALNQRVARLTVDNVSRLSADYFYYFLISDLFKKELSAVGHGAAQQNVSPASIAGLTIPLLPLPQQKRIVAILDEAFAGITQAVANAEKNLTNARELFESYLNNVFAQKGEGWIEKRLGEFTKSISTGPFGSLLHKSDYVTNGVPLVNPTNIVDGIIIPDKKKLIDDSTKKRLSSYVLSGGDMVIGRRGEIGRCAVVGREQDGWICGTGCFFISPSLEVNPDFLAHLIRSNTYRETLENAATGATMKNISNKVLSNLRVRIPSLNKQNEILKLLSDLSQQTQHLETIYQQKLNALSELKQSILQKAFAGELATK